MIKSNWQNILIMVILLAGSLWWFSQKKLIKENNLKINNQTVTIEVVKSVKDMAKGLSGRESLCSDCGMLFAYADYHVRQFWMKDMNFALDIVWIKDDVIVGFAENIQTFDAQGEITRITSNEAVNLVLELNAGWIGQNNVKIGDKVAGID